MSSVFYSNNTLTCVNDNDEDDKAAGVAVLAVVVASILMSCTVIVVTIVSARNVVKRGSVSSDIDDVVVVADAEVYATVARRGTAVSAVVFQASAEMGCVDNDDNDVFEDEDDGLDTLYDKPTTDAERIYGPIMIRYKYAILFIIVELVSKSNRMNKPNCVSRCVYCKTKISPFKERSQSCLKIPEDQGSKPVIGIFY